MDLHGYLWIYMKISGYPWISKDISGCSAIPPPHTYASTFLKHADLYWSPEDSWTIGQMQARLQAARPDASLASGCQARFQIRRFFLPNQFSSFQEIREAAHPVGKGIDLFEHSQYFDENSSFLGSCASLLLESHLDHQKPLSAPVDLKT